MSSSRSESKRERDEVGGNTTPEAWKSVSLREDMLGAPILPDLAEDTIPEGAARHKSRAQPFGA